MTRRLLLRAGGGLVVVGLLVGPAAQAQAPQASPERHARPAYGHTSDEWLMMGRNCGASITAM
jgi:hypothetical protein